MKRSPEPLSHTAWLPAGKTAAVCFTIDDVHPATSADAYEAGGDLGAGALGHVEWLLDRHPDLRVTLFVTPDWREISPVPTRRLLAGVPYLRDRVHLARRWPRGRMRLDRHPEFVAYLRGMGGVEVALHGLHHTHVGRRIPIEFQEQDRATCRAMLREAMRLFEDAGLPFSPGMTPPGFNAPEPLLEAMADVGLRWVASARDIRTPVSAEATTAMTGLRGLSLVRPEPLSSVPLLHVPTNFQATSPLDRARQILDGSGLLSIKAHIVKNAMGHIALDGLDELYRNYLDLLFSALEREYGASLWWTTMGEIAEHVAGPSAAAASSSPEEA